MRFDVAGRPLSLEEYREVVGNLIYEVWAVIKVETAGFGFDRGRRPRILFERHVFHRLTGGKFDNFPELSNPRPGGYTTHEYHRLQFAMDLDEEAALKSCSWGIGQVMGFNHRRAGYPTVQTMVEAFKHSEKAQLVGMLNFIDAAGLRDELERHDWLAFAYGYNGPAQKGYDVKLEREYLRMAGRTARGGQGMINFDIRRNQAELYFAGFLNADDIDGIDGPRTAAARAASLMA